MGFILKKTIRVPFAKDGQSFVLIMKRVRLETVLALLNEHLAQFGAAGEQARSAGKQTVVVPVELLREVSAIVREAALGWEGVLDEQGNAVVFSPERFDELFGYDLEFFGTMLAALMGGAKEPKDSEKNCSRSSKSVAH